VRTVEELARTYNAALSGGPFFMSTIDRMRRILGTAVPCTATLVAILSSQDAWAQPSTEATKPEAALSAPAARLPVDAYASLPLLSRLVLSPDGQQIAALLNHDKETLLITRSTLGGALQVVLKTDNQRFFINWIEWVNNERLVVGMRFAGSRHFVGTVETRLLSIKSDGSGVVNLVRNLPRSDSMSGSVPSQQVQDEVIDWMPDDGHHVLLQLSEAERSVYPTVYKVNVETGNRRMVKSEERDVRHWMTDAAHRVRVGMRHTDEHTELRVCDPDGKNWRTLWTFDDPADGVWPLGFGRDPQELFVRANHDGRMAVFSVRLDDPSLKRTLRLAHPRLDVRGGLLTSPLSGEVLGLHGRIDSEADGDDTHSELWEPGWRDVARGIDQRLPQRNNRLLDISRDEQRFIVYSSGNGQPGQYYLGNKGSGELALLGDQYPALATATLVGKQPIAVKARDGLSLNAYLTLPAGRRAGDAGPVLPMVLLPHGGPQSLDGDDFDPWTEFLASRGYAVLQVNFRGSAGYGFEFQQAGLKRWGLEMQDDLTDAVQWAVAQRVADADRVCIVGASYGGYAALMGAVKTPSLYRCAVSFAGVSDLPDLIQFERDYVGGAKAMDVMLGKVWGDRTRLRATSPALQAERIIAPVLLVHGTADRVVPVDQSAGMAKALRRAGKQYQFIELEGGDHHLSRQAHRLEFFTALEKFLDENLMQAPPVRATSAPAL
jgi:dipeptidyl aminopeptidase/acylaminoacyl peptidase